jgi:peptidoglycan/xylan/chitin deacetylase (PgdA/CDA1 family)
MTVACATTRSLPRIPVEDWRPSTGKQISNVVMRTVANIAGTASVMLGSRAGNSVGILVYHRVVPLVKEVPAPPYNVIPESFHKQLTGLLKRGFRFLSLKEIIACHENGECAPPRSVVLTFDDCFESVYTFAWPILQELGIPATLFLSTAYLDSETPFPFDTWALEFRDCVPASHYNPIRGEQCREMIAGGLVDLGTHTHTHADFRQRITEFKEEMQLAAEIVELRFGEVEPLFALPFGNPHAGYASAEMFAAVRDSGARCALTTECSLVDTQRDPFGWGRINVFDWDTSFTLSGKLAGWYDWAPRLKHQLQLLLKRSMP